MTEQPVCFVGYSASDFVGSAHSIVMAEIFNHTTTRVGVGRTATGVMSHPRVQHGHGRALLSRRLRALISRLDRATIRGLVIDDDRGARVELGACLCDVGSERKL